MKESNKRLKMSHTKLFWSFFNLFFFGTTTTTTTKTNKKKDEQWKVNAQNNACTPISLFNVREPKRRRRNVWYMVCLQEFVCFWTGNSLLSGWKTETHRTTETIKPIPVLNRNTMDRSLHLTTTTKIISTTTPFSIQTKSQSQQ